MIPSWHISIYQLNEKTFELIFLEFEWFCCMIEYTQKIVSLIYGQRKNFLELKKVLSIDRHFFWPEEIDLFAIKTFFLWFKETLPWLQFPLKYKDTGRRNPAGSKNIEKYSNWGIGKDRTFLSLPTHHFASLKLYLSLSPHLSRVTENIYVYIYPMTGNIYFFTSLSLFVDWSSIYIFLYLSWSTTLFFLSLIYLPIVQA